MKKGAWMRLAKLVFFIIILVHWITCIWFLMYRLLRPMGWRWTFDVYVGPESTMATYFFSG